MAYDLNFIFSYTFWKLVVFIEQGGKIVDGEISTPINVDALKHLVTFTSANNQPYSVVEVSHFKAVKHDSLFTFYTTQQIKYDDIVPVQSQLNQIWTTHGMFQLLLI